MKERRFPERLSNRTAGGGAGGGGGARRRKTRQQLPSSTARQRFTTNTSTVRLPEGSAEGKALAAANIRGLE